MTMSVGLAKIQNDPDAPIMTRKALGALSTPGLLVHDTGLSIDNDGRIIIKLNPDGGLLQDENGVSLIDSLLNPPVKVGIDSEVDPRSEAYDREWNARLTGPAPNYIESSLAIGEEEFGGVSTAFPYDLIAKTKVAITSNDTQLRLRYDLENFASFRVLDNGLFQLFCVGEVSPGLYIVTGGGTAGTVEGGVTVNFGTTLKCWLAFTLTGGFGGGGAPGTVSTWEEVFTVTFPESGMTLLSGGANIVSVSPTSDFGGQVMSWSARIHSANKIAVKFSYFDALGAFAPTWKACVFQFL